MTVATTREPEYRAELEELVKRAEELSADYGDAVAEAVRLAAEEPLDVQTATRLYTRVLQMLRAGGRDLTEEQRTALADEVRAEVKVIVSAARRPPATGHDALASGLQWVVRNGLTPHDVAPIPTFNTSVIPMREGYVDVNDLQLWQENHRVELYVREFKDRNDREPDQLELLALMHGTLDDLPSLREQSKDPFDIVALARSIARKGVERPPIVTYDGTPKDGNRRISASKYVLSSNDFTAEEKERARWIRVWQAPAGTTDDQFEDIVVALNFEDDHKRQWPEYVKGRLVVDRYRLRRDDVTGMLTAPQERRLRADVAKAFAITPADVLRYLRMVQWAEDFESYHVDERGMDDAKVRYRANDVFQWFYEIQAGKAGTKLTEQLAKDEALRPVVYDLMFDVLDSGAQVRALHTVVADPAALKLLQQAHDEAGEDRADQALALVNEAIAEARRKAPTKKLGFEQWLRGAVERLGTTSPDDWHKVSDTGLLAELRRVMPSALGAVDGELTSRGITVPASEQ